MSEQVEKVFQDIGCHNVSFSIAQDMIHERTGEYISYNRLYYLSSRGEKDVNDIKTAGNDLVNCMRRTSKCVYSFLLHNIEEDKSPLSQKSLEVQQLGESNFPTKIMSDGEVKYLNNHTKTMEKRIHSLMK